MPFDSDIYAVPVDMVRPAHRSKGKKPPRNKKRAKNTQNMCANLNPSEKIHKPKEINKHKDVKTKRHSLPSSSCKKNTADSDTDSLHLTLREMRKYLHTLYSSSSDSECRATVKKNTIVTSVNGHTRYCSKEGNASFILKDSNEISKSVETNNNHKSSKNTFGMNTKNKKHKDNQIKDVVEVEKSERVVKKTSNTSQKSKMSPVRILSLNLKQSFCNLFRWRRQPSAAGTGPADEVERIGEAKSGAPAAVRRALPPLPSTPQASHAARRTNHEQDNVTDFATSLHKVKDVSSQPFTTQPI